MTDKLAAIIAGVIAVAGAFAMHGSGYLDRLGFWPPKGQPMQPNTYRKVADYIEALPQLEGDLLLTPEIGAISFFEPHIIFRDINGIASPNVTRQTINDWEHFVALYRPRFILPMFDRWPEIVSFRMSDGSLKYYRKEFVAAPKGETPRDAPLYVRADDFALPPLEIPAHLKFAQGSPDRQRLSMSWGLSELGGWTTGFDIAFTIPLARPAGEYDIVLHLYPFIPPREKRRTLIIEQEGRIVYETVETVAQPRAHRFRGAPGVARIDLRLVTPDAVAPAHVGDGPGHERIAFMLMELEIIPVEENQ